MSDRLRAACSKADKEISERVKVLEPSRKEGKALPYKLKLVRTIFYFLFIFILFYFIFNGLIYFF
jgi:hypothetical protein